MPSTTKFKTWHAVLILIAIWQIVAMVVGQEYLLSSPLEVLKAFARLCITKAFYINVGNTVVKVLTGYFSAVITSALLAYFSYRYNWVRTFLKPVVSVIKAVPVASFIIIALIWIKSKNLCVFISFLMSFPVIYTSVLAGLDNTDRKLIEVADIFRTTQWGKIKAVYLSSAKPFIISSCSTAMGFAFKSGIAAEVIALSPSSIGEMLYNCKVYFETPELLAWTVAVVLVSHICEKIFSSLLRNVL